VGVPASNAGVAGDAEDVVHVVGDQHLDDEVAPPHLLPCSPAAALREFSTTVVNTPPVVNIVHEKKVKTGRAARPSRSRLSRTHRALLS